MWNLTRNKLFVLFIVGLSAVFNHPLDCIFDAKIKRIARLQLFLARKQSEKERGLTTSPEALNFEIASIDRRIKDLTNQVSREQLTCLVSLFKYPKSSVRFDRSESFKKLNESVLLLRINDRRLKLIEEENQALKDFETRLYR